MDLYDHQLIGYALSDNMPVALPLEALEMAVRRRRPGPGLIHHSDQGSQYASTAYQGRMDELGFVPSMSRKGNCWDNAVMERFFGSLKSEWTDARVYTTREAARLDVVEYIEMQYNSVRPHTTLGSLYWAVSRLGNGKRLLLKMGVRFYLTRTDHNDRPNSALRDSTHKTISRSWVARGSRSASCCTR